jgi:prevent-host-death family protein
MEAEMAQGRVVHVVTATEVKSNFGKIIKRAYASDEDLIVERGGIPVVAIIPISVYQKSVGAPVGAPSDVMQRVATASERAEASQRLGDLLDHLHAQLPEVNESEAERLINAEVTKLRPARRKHSPATKRTTHTGPVRSRRRVKP